jgi:hypothetical protein
MEIGLTLVIADLKESLVFILSRLTLLVKLLQLQVVLDPDQLAVALSLKGLHGGASALVVKESMRVSVPSDASEKQTSDHTKLLHLVPVRVRVLLRKCAIEVCAFLFKALVAGRH